MTGYGFVSALLGFLAVAMGATEVLGAVLAITGLHVLFALPVTFSLQQDSEDEVKLYVGGVGIWLSSFLLIAAAYRAFVAASGLSNAVSPA